MLDFVCGVCAAGSRVAERLAMCGWSCKNGRQDEGWGREEMSTLIALLMAIT